MPNRIKELRKKRNLTQTQLAAMTNSSRQQIYRLEKDRTDLSSSWVKRIAAALNCEPWELLDPDGEGLSHESRMHSMSNRIRELRLKSNLTQRQLARKVGASHQQIQLLERGHRDLRLSWIKRIASALNCEPWELLDKAGGSMSQDEWDIVNKYRSLPPDQKLLIHAYFMAGYKNNILGGYSALTKADRQIVNHFLFDQHARPEG